MEGRCGDEVVAFCADAFGGADEVAVDIGVVDVADAAEVEPEGFIVICFGEIEFCLEPDGAVDAVEGFDSCVFPAVGGGEGYCGPIFGMGGGERGVGADFFLPGGFVFCVFGFVGVFSAHEVLLGEGFGFGLFVFEEEFSDGVEVFVGVVQLI